MGRVWAFVSLVAGALVLASPASAAVPNEARIVDEQRVTDRVIELTISTPAFTEPTKVHVDLPVGYRSHRSRHWPVTYYTSGTMNNYNTFNDFLKGEKLTRHFPSILVSPDGNSGYWSDWYNDAAFGPPMYETYVIDQLIPLIDARFRTAADRSQRAIFGISMGGYGSAMLAARHPDLFGAVATLSGAVDSNLPANGAVLSLSSTFDGAEPDAIYGPRSTQEVRWRGHNPTDLAANLRDLDLQVRTANGVPNPGIGEDPASADFPSCIVEGGVHMASVSMHEKLVELGIGHEWKDYGPGCHTVPNFRREVIDTLDAFERVFADPPKPPAMFEYRSIEPRFSVWGWRVAADPERALEFMRMKSAGRGGLTLIGSGATDVRTPPFFRGLDAVDVVTSGQPPGVLAPDGRGRLDFSVDLGPPHPDQQYTGAARSAGGGEPGYFTTRTVKLIPHARLLLGRLREGRARIGVCARSLGAAIARERISLFDRDGRRVAKTRRFSQPLGERCVALRPLRSQDPAPGRYTIRARALDAHGHRVTAKRRARLR